MNRLGKLCAAMILGACALPVVAQTQQSQDAQAPEKPEKIVLEEKQGSVLTSVGGDYETANIGRLLVRDESMMLSDKAEATVVYYYDNGKRKCTEVYKGPNTFIIDDSCKVAAYWAGSGNGGAIGGVIAGAAILGAVMVGSGGKVPPSPVSGSSR